MKRGLRIVLAAGLAFGSLAVSAPVQASECTPRGCTGSCRVGDIRDASIDLDTMTVDLPPLIECTS